MRIIAIVNQKGGCGKTSTAINLAACLALMERIVLVVDLDPQAHATIGLNINIDELQRCIYHALVDGSESGLEDISRPILNNLDLVPSHTMLYALEQKLANADRREDRLRDCINQMLQGYDYIMIDCPPNVGVLTLNALNACNEAIVPVEASVFSLQGLAKLMETINSVERNRNHKIRIKALATIHHARTRFAGEVLENIRQHFKERLFDTRIRSSVRLREAASYGKPVILYDKNSAVAKDYVRLATEVINEEKTISTSCGYEEVTFTVEAPTGKTVQVVGDFNKWGRRQNVLTKKHDDIWGISLKLKPGRYEYGYIIDDEWHTDPSNPNTVENPYGGINSVLNVRYKGTMGRTDDDDRIRAIVIKQELEEILNEHRRLFTENSGGELDPDDPIFFDPDADIPQSITRETSDQLVEQMVKVMRQAGFNEGDIYAYRKTGLLITEENIDLMKPEELEEFEEAVKEYEIRKGIS